MSKSTNEYLLLKAETDRSLHILFLVLNRPAKKGPFIRKALKCCAITGNHLITYDHISLIQNPYEKVRGLVGLNLFIFNHRMAYFIYNVDVVDKYSNIIYKKIPLS